MLLQHFQNLQHVQGGWCLTGNQKSVALAICDAEDAQQRWQPAAGGRVLMISTPTYVWISLIEPGNLEDQQDGVPV